MPDMVGNWNSSYGSSVVVDGAMPGGVFLWVVLILFGTIVLLLLLTSIDRYTKFFKALEWFYNSIRYTVFGAGIGAAFYALYLACEAIARVGSGIDPIYVGYIIGGYAGFTLLGYAGSWTWNRIKTMREMYAASLHADVAAEVK